MQSFVCLKGIQSELLYLPLSFTYLYAMLSYAMSCTITYKIINYWTIVILYCTGYFLAADFLFYYIQKFKTEFAFIRVQL